MTGADFISSMLALRAWQDGRTEGVSGMLGVAFTIRNRVKAGWYGADWIKVLEHHKEWAASEDPTTEELPDPRTFSFQTLIQSISGIISGSTKDDITQAGDHSVGGSILSVPPPPALYYGRIDNITRPWFLENISLNHEQHKRISQVGMLVFWT